MRSLTLLAGAAWLLLSIAPSPAQMDLFGEDETLWSTHRLNPKVKVTLDFRNASVDAVLQVLSRASGIPIVKDPSLTQPITLQSPKQQTLRDAFSMLSVALGLRGYELKRDGAMMVVKQKQQRGGSGGRGGSSGTSGFDMSAMASMFGSSQQTSTVLKVYNIKYASASQVARVINDVFALTANQGFGMFGMPGMMGMPGMPGGMPGMPGGGPGGGGPGGGGPGGAPATPGGAPSTTPTPGPRADSGRIVPAVNQTRGADGGSNLELVAQRGGGMFGGGGGMFGGGGGGMFGGGMGQFGRRGGGGSSQSSTVRASSDDYSNTVIVNASSTDHEQIAKLIAEIDKEADKAQISKVYPLEYATATDLTSIIMNVLNANASRGRGYTGQQNTGGGGGMFGQMFGGNRMGGSAASSGVGTVAAETRTNSLIVTTVPDNQEVVQQVIKELDKPIKFETGAFVISLKNARADTVASLINSSFGGGRAGTTANRTGTGSTRTNTSTSRTTNNRSTGGLPSLNAPARAADVVPTEVLTDEEIVDAVRRGDDPQALAAARAQGMGGFGGMISQIMGGGGGGNRSSQSSTQNAVSYDSYGRVVTYQNLSGTVSAIADTNTNSVIIVTSPQNREILQKILDQLDRIPEQVMIETLIVEASLDATNKLGVEWNFKGGSSAITSAFGLAADTAQPQGMRYTLTAKEYSGFLSALKTDNRFEVLSTPRIFTSNNSEAEINISQSLPYVTNQRVDSNGNYSYSYSFMDVGIVLTVTPRITSNGYVTMDVTQTANDFVRYTDFNAPVVNQREAQTTVSVRDGETVVLGGIIKGSLSSTVNKIPILGDLPLLGAAFRSTSQIKSKTELLVFLSPKVVRDEADARALRERVEGQLQPKTLEKVLSTRQGEPPTTEKSAPAKLEPLKDGAKVPGKS